MASEETPTPQQLAQIASQRIAAARTAGAVELDLSDLGLKSIPPAVFSLTRLTKLNLSSKWGSKTPNQLTALPPEIAKLTALTTLWLSSNQLTALPPEIAKLTALTTLYLSDNQLTALPPELGLLEGLMTLKLDGNPLPDAIHTLAKQGVKPLLAYLRSLLNVARPL